ncbi:hypothetical protein CEXT_25101 [Caerostris extrusa]|uniref:Uncharacterized protein n=1 Tax=Caerostris extrusa TaxID=172846 RepID=A0AAV4MTC7_CAEEX|nr:hypothetical protein CEXT_25101 [Caerostris extrusa]
MPSPISTHEKNPGKQMSICAENDAAKFPSDFRDHLVENVAIIKQITSARLSKMRLATFKAASHWWRHPAVVLTSCDVRVESRIAVFIMLTLYLYFSFAIRTFLALK